MFPHFSKGLSGIQREWQDSQPCGEIVYGQRIKESHFNPQDPSFHSLLGN